MVPRYYLVAAVVVITQIGRHSTCPTRLFIHFVLFGAQSFLYADWIGSWDKNLKQNGTQFDATQMRIFLFYQKHPKKTCLYNIFKTLEIDSLSFYPEVKCAAFDIIHLIHSKVC